MSFFYLFIYFIVIANIFCFKSNLLSRIPYSVSVSVCVSVSVIPFPFPDFGAAGSCSIFLFVPFARVAVNKSLAVYIFYHARWTDFEEKIEGL